MDKIQKAWISAILLLSTLAVNAMGAKGFINGKSQKEISDMYQTLITPSSFVFSIWSIIYALLIASTIVMIIKKDDPYYEKAIENISGLFWGSSILNIIWIISFSYVLIEMSALLIFGILITLALVCKKLLEIQEGKRWLLPLSFGLYAGWLVIATMVNISATIVKSNWNGFGVASEIWTVIIIIVGVALTIAILLNNKNAALPLPIAWAYYGIYKALKVSKEFNQDYNMVYTILLLGIVTLIGAAIFQCYKNNYGILPDKKQIN